MDSILEWRHGWPSTKQTLTLGGYAGTGKTTGIAYLTRMLPAPLVVCPTGKAANVLQSKGVDAKTIHSQIYVPRERNGQVTYRRRQCIDAETIIVDEASMVNMKLCRSFSLPTCLVAVSLRRLLPKDHSSLESIKITEFSMFRSSRTVLRRD
jgi:hypothetical protein